MRIAINLPAEVHWHARGLFTALDGVPRRVVLAGALSALVVGASFTASAVASVVRPPLSAPAAGAHLAHLADSGETAVAPEAVAPSTAGSPASIPVAPPAPVRPPPGLRVARVAMPRLGIDHGIERVGVVDGQMESPSDGVNAVGWYPEYATPGYGGNTVFAAHETWNQTHAPFYSLHLARDGDEVEVTLSDGARMRYLVISNTRYDVRRIPMGEIIWPSGMSAGEERATFITCGGRFVPSGGGLGEYLDRDVIVARRV